MSCESRAARFAALAGKVSAGMTSLAGKRAFYVGVAVGSTGAAALTAVITRFRPVCTGRRGRARPRAIISGGTQTTGAGSRANPKPLAGIRKSSVSGSRANPQPLAGIGKSSASGSRANPRPLPGLNRPPVTARPGPATRLKPGPVQVSIGRGQTTTMPDSYRVVKPDGAETGLALTRPVSSARDGWMITHTDSGLAMGGPYDSVQAAQTIAGQLAVVVEDDRLSQAEKMKAARKIIGPGKGG